ncbi:MAG: hypothetical protein ACRDZ2_01745, partial [Ilumatobacteraceae bacterium]
MSDTNQESSVDIADIETPDSLPTGDVDVLAEQDPAAEVDLEVVSDEVAEATEASEAELDATDDVAD